MKYSKNKIIGSNVYYYKDKFYSFTYEEIAPILEYSNDKNLSKDFIKLKYSLSQDVLDRRLKIMGLEDKRTRIQIDKTIFHTISTEEQAYWLGFITADGYINEKKYYLRLSLQKSDKHHLEKFCDFLKLDYSHIRVHDGTEKTYHVEVFGKELINDLKKYGLFQGKSLKEVYYNLNRDDLQTAYIRGLIDGDGSINKKYIALVGSEDIVLNVRNYFNDIFNFDLNYIYQDHKMFVFKIQKRELIHLILNKLYNGSKIHLDRKYEIFQLYNTNKEKL